MAQGRRDELLRLGLHATPKQVVDALGRRGVEVSVTFTEDEAEELLSSVESVVEQAEERASTFRNRNENDGGS